MSTMSKRRAKFYRNRPAGPIQAIHPTTRKLIEVDYQKDAKITDPHEDLFRLPGTTSWYLKLRDLAKDEVVEARHNEHNTEEDLSVKIRDKAEGRGETLKETEIKMRVKAHPKMRAAYRRRMDAERMLRHLESAVVAMLEKKWALQAWVKLRLADNAEDNA